MSYMNHPWWLWIYLWSCLILTTPQDKHPFHLSILMLKPSAWQIKPNTFVEGVNLNVFIQWWEVCCMLGRPWGLFLLLVFHLCPWNVHPGILRQVAHRSIGKKGIHPFSSECSVSLATVLPLKVHFLFWSPSPLLEKAKWLFFFTEKPWDMGCEYHSPCFGVTRQGMQSFRCIFLCAPLSWIQERGQTPKKEGGISMKVHDSLS